MGSGPVRRLAEKGPVFRGARSPMKIKKAAGIGCQSVGPAGIRTDPPASGEGAGLQGSRSRMKMKKAAGIGCQSVGPAGIEPATP